MKENTAQKRQEPDMNYVTFVLRYYEKNKKTAHAVTDITSMLISAIQQYNKTTGYDGTKFDLYGICVESDTDIAQGKNDFVKQIDS